MLSLPRPPLPSAIVIIAPSALCGRRVCGGWDWLSLNEIPDAASFAACGSWFGGNHA
jgi:hypothetical protein|eukprot:COSAG01_NODE_9770_length_2349_cov_1.145333_4_plen_57_part_00